MGRRYTDMAYADWVLKYRARGDAGMFYQGRTSVDPDYDSMYPVLSGPSLRQTMDLYDNRLEIRPH